MDISESTAEHGQPSDSKEAYCTRTLDTLKIRGRESGKGSDAPRMQRNSLIALESACLGSAAAFMWSVPSLLGIFSMSWVSHV